MKMVCILIDAMPPKQKYCFLYNCAVVDLNEEMHFSFFLKLIKFQVHNIIVMLNYNAK